MPNFVKFVATMQSDVGLFRESALSDRVYRSGDGPPAYVAHLMLDGVEYVLSLVPTDLDTIQHDAGEEE